MKRSGRVTLTILRNGDGRHFSCIVFGALKVPRHRARQYHVIAPSSPGVTNGASDCDFATPRLRGHPLHDRPHSDPGEMDSPTYIVPICSIRRHVIRIDASVSSADRAFLAGGLVVADRVADDARHLLRMWSLLRVIVHSPLSHSHGPGSGERRCRACAPVRKVTVTGGTSHPTCFFFSAS